MSLLLNITFFLAGLFILALASDNLIKSSVKLSSLFKLSTLFIGLILIAFGTSLPEGTVSIVAVAKDYKDIALGNVVGSNIANIALVLGVSGLICPLKVMPSLFKWEIPMMLFSAGLLFVFCINGVISRLEGAIFLLVFILFCVFSYRGSKLQKDYESFKSMGLFSKINTKPLIFFMFIVFLGLLVLGANIMVSSGVNIAEIFGISTWVIGLTVFALGTSLPELAASVSASVKKVSSIGVGNVIGSNIFNILLMLGIISVIKPIDVDSSVLRYEMPWLVVLSLLACFFMRKGKVSRLQSGILVLFYVIFIVTVIIK